jgi:phosphoglycolate phosphatase-like HAD superfamily hydrolase
MSCLVRASRAVCNQRLCFNASFSTAAASSDYLIIFDKDGTLIDFNFMWATFAEQHAQKVIESEALRSESEVKQEEFRTSYYEAMDYDPVTRTVGARGALACSPMFKISELTSTVLGSHVASSPEDLRAITDVITVAATPDPIESCSPTTPDIVGVFEQLTAMNCKIAVCTTDDRAPTLKTVDHLGLNDMVIGCSCGDDKGRASKPDREQVDYLRELAGGIPAERTIMVGDTPTDMRLGSNSKCVLTVGIIGGSSLVEDLAPLADCMIGDLEQLPLLVELVQKGT